MICDMCKNNIFNEGKTVIMLVKDETIIVFKGVPALVCSQCGEAYTDAKVTSRLHSIVKEEAQRGPMEAFVQYIPTAA
jgi:YgiT-type zinc finger domain-containing protein